MKRRTKCQHHGGGSSDYSGSFHAWGADPAQLSRFTLNNISNAAMFHPLESGTVFPTGTSGIIPTGSYYNAQLTRGLQNSLGPPTPGFIQMGGKKTNPWIEHVRRFAQSYNITYAEALKHPQISEGYTKINKKK